MIDINKIKTLLNKKNTPITKSSTSKTYKDRKAILVNETIRISFKNDISIIKLVKRIVQIKFIKGDSTQYYQCPITLDAIQKLKIGGFDFDENLKKWEKSIFSKPVFNTDFKIPNIKNWKYWKQFQKEGVQHIEHKNGRCLLADDQGLGKTLQIIGWVQYREDINKSVLPMLIICPSSAKYVWNDEFIFWSTLNNIQIIKGNEDQKIWGDIVIINYDVLSQVKKVWNEEEQKHENIDTLRKDIWKIDWEFIAIDEAHYISNEETIRGWAVKHICNKTPHVIPITATPGKHRPKNLFMPIHLADKRIFPSFYKYAHKYCDAKKGYKGIWNFEGSSNEEELFDLLSKTIMIRRKKEDVFGKDIRKIRQVIPLEIKNRKEYKEAEEKYEGKYTFDAIEELSQLAVKGKMDETVDWLWELLETEDKVVIFAEHKEVVNILMNEFGDIALRYDGSTNDKNKEQAKQLFQQCKRCKIKKEKHAFDKNACKEYEIDLNKRVIVCSSSGKEALTLTAAWHVVFVELWWSPTDHDQAEDRVFGRTGDYHGATCWYLIARGTIEEYKANVFDLKNQILTKVMDGKDISKEMMLKELIKQRSKNKC